MRVEVVGCTPRQGSIVDKSVVALNGPYTRPLVFHSIHASLAGLNDLIYLQIYISNPYIYIYIFLAVLDLCCCMWAFSSCGERGLLFIVVHGLLIAVASRCGAWALGRVGFSSCGSQA